MQGWETNSTRTWEVGADVVDAMRTMAELDDADLPRLEAAFDPRAFQDQHPDPSFDAFQLTEDQLHDQGVFVTQIRQQISKRALDMEATRERGPEARRQGLLRSARPRSKPEHSLDGRSEGELRQ